MKRFEIPMVAALLVGLSFLAGLGVPAAHADFTFGAPVNLRTVIPVLDPMNDVIAAFSADGLEMYLFSYRPGGYGWGDLWVSSRDSTDAVWGPPQNLGPTVNTAGEERSASISPDGLTLYFNSFDPNRPGAQGDSDIYMTTRATRKDPWGPAVNLGPTVNSPQLDDLPSIAPDGLELYSISGRPGGSGSNDIYVSRRATTSDPWGHPENLGPVVNSETDDTCISLSPDGLLLFFNEGDLRAPRPGGYGATDLWMTRRAGRAAPWAAPVNGGPQVNGPDTEIYPRVSPDGAWLYWSWANADWTVFENFRAPLLPIVDFNGDKKVDLTDLRLLVDNWGTDKTLYDIGPYAWGDGKVDIEDLKVFVTYFEKANPPAQP